MAKIQLIIEADNAFELQEILAGFRSGGGSFVGQTGEQTFDEADIHPQDQPAAEAPKRTRRTKAEIEADNARAAGAGSTAAPAISVSGAGTATGSSKHTGDVFGDQLKEVATEAAGDVTKAMVSDAMAAAIGKVGAPAVQALIVEHAAGAKSLGGVDPSHYAALHTALLGA